MTRFFLTVCRGSGGHTDDGEKLNDKVYGRGLFAEHGKGQDVDAEAKGYGSDEPSDMGSPFMFVSLREYNIP